jgi:hypothetical protein
VFVQEIKEQLQNLNLKKAFKDLNQMVTRNPEFLKDLIR